MEEDKTLADYGLTSSLAKAQSPAEVGLAFSDGGVFEELEKTPYSNPPELPDVMKPGQEASTQETTTAWWEQLKSQFLKWTTARSYEKKKPHQFSDKTLIFLEGNSIIHKFFLIKMKIKN